MKNKLQSTNVVFVIVELFFQINLHVFSGNKKIITLKKINMSILIMKLYETLSTKFGAETEETFSNFVDEKINTMGLNLEAKFTRLENLIKTEIATAKADVFRWMVGVFVTALAVLLSAMFLIKN